jgi:DNA helicase-2/ATP-dependent DNA helicase PcrA
MQVAADPVQSMCGFVPPAAAAAPWRDWLDTAQALRTARWPDDLVRAIAWYRPQLERLHDDAAIRLRDLDQLARLAGGHASRERFLAELTLDPPQATSDDAGAAHRDEDWLVLSTIHAAKGQEWAAVNVLNVVDGCMPSDLASDTAAQLEEERRLLYVAMTRAKRHLALLVPLRFHVTQQPRHGDRHLYGGPSRFLTAPVLACFMRETAAGTPGSTGGTTSTPAAAPVDLQARLRRMF